MPRYFVVALAVFSSVTAALMWLVKKDTAVISMILLITFIAIAFFGPLSGYSLTLTSQTHQLERLLIANEMLSSDGQLKPNAEISKATQSEISEKITFLIDAYAVDQIKVLPEGFSGDNAKQYLGFDLLYYWDRNQSVFERFNYFTKMQTELITLDGADYMLNMRQYDVLEKTLLTKGLSIEKKFRRTYD